jgi:NitT/TauT family transport system ATP-binding protein
MQDLLTRIWESHRLTVMFVTHDIEEAVYLSDRIVVMGLGPGRIKTSYHVGLARPRHEDMVSTAEFIALQREVLRSIREEERKAS